MPSKARRAFDQNAKDVTRLLEIHEHLGGDGPGRRYRLEVLNKSAIVLITAIWEAYCEDIASEALNHLVKHLSNGSALPKELKKRIAKEIKELPNEIAIWDLADSGWKAIVEARLGPWTKETNRKFNTAKSDNIDQLFLNTIGLDTVSKAWQWKKMTAQNARKKLDSYVELRGAIAHRGSSASTCTKTQVEAYFIHVQHLVSNTGGEISKFLRNVTGKKLW
jgi:RiboL-PSP-HEPN